MALQKFVENYTVPISPNQIEIPEKPILTESTNGKQYEALVILKRVYFGKYSEGQNGRTYSKPLWEKQIRQGIIEGIPSIDSHLDDPKPTQIVGVWHNAGFDENGPYADYYIINETIAKAVRAGIRTLGISTSAYGELVEGTNYVSENNFQMLSIDAVFNPSMSVFLSYEQIGESVGKKQKKQESTNTNTVDTVKSNQVKITERGNTVMSDRMKLEEADMKLKEKNLRNHAKDIHRKAQVAIKENDSQKLHESAKEIKENMGIFESAFPDWSEKLSEDLAIIEEKFEEAIVANISSIEDAKNKLGEKDKEINTLKRVAEDQKKDIAVLTELIDSIKTGSNTFTENQVKTYESNVKGMAEDLHMAIKERSDMAKDLKILEKISDSLEERLKKVTMNYESARKDVINLTSENKKLKEELETLQPDYSDYTDVEQTDQYERNAHDTQTIATDPSLARQWGTQEDPDYMTSGLNVVESVKQKPKANLNERTAIRAPSPEQIAIREYFKAEAEKVPFIKQYEKEILSVKSIREAISIVDQIKDHIKDNAPSSLTESTSRNVNHQNIPY